MLALNETSASSQTDQQPSDLVSENTTQPRVRSNWAVCALYNDNTYFSILSLAKNKLKDQENFKLQLSAQATHP